MNKKKEPQAQADDRETTEVEIEHRGPEPEEVPEDERPADRKERAAPEAEEPAAAEPEPDWEDRYLRLAAEFDNYKKRSSREFARIIKNAEGELILELTEVLDNLERALDPEHRAGDLREFVKGIDLIYEQFKSVLEKRGLVRMKVVGEPFDPEKHEAMMQIDSAEIPEGHITGEIAVGYLLGDKVLRHAKVIVSRGPAPEEEEKETNEE
jgi:molecular chaperone GrpE